MKTQQAIFSFSSGVLTPRISARADSPKFNSALLTGQNFIISPQGGAIYRQGTQFIEQTNQSRIFQFHQGGNESDIIMEFLPTNTYGAGDIHFHGDSTIVIPSLGGDYPPNFSHAYNSTDLKRLYFVNQERFGICCSANHPPLYLELISQTEITATELPADKISNYDYDDLNSPSAAQNIDATYDHTFTAGNIDGPWADGQLFLLSYNGHIATDSTPEPLPIRLEFSFSVPTDTIKEITRGLDAISALQGLGTVYGVTSSGGTTYQTTIQGKNAGGTLQLIPYQAGGTDRTIPTITTSTAGSGLEPAWSYPTYVEHPADSGTYYECIKPHRSETGVNEPPDAEFWTLLAGKPDTFDWQYPQENDWVDDHVYSPGGRGFPTVAVFHQQRLIFAAPPQAGTAIWGSRIGVYDDFFTGINSADPFSFTLDSTDTPTIKWIASQLQLIVGTSAGDWSVSAEVSLGPTDIQASKQNYARSDHTVPVAIDTNVFYLEQGQTKVRMTQYQRNNFGFVSSDISLISEHLFHVGVKRIVILRTPEVMMLILRNDGVLLGLTYVGGEGGMGAWYELTSQGHIEDIAAYYSTVTQQDELWVNTSYNWAAEGPNSYYLEVMPYPSRKFTPYTTTDDLSPDDTTLTEQGVICMDSWSVQPVVNNVISGLEHLNGQVVGALVDDAWTGTYLVSNGMIQLDDANISGSEPYNSDWSAVGLLYDGLMKTFEVVTGNNRGTGLGTTRRWSKLYTRLLDSSLPIINGVLPPDRTPQTEMNIAEIIREGLQDVSIRGAGWGDGSITILQNRPYPTQIVGLFGEFQSGND